MATKDTDLNFLHILSTYDFILYKLNDFSFPSLLFYGQLGYLAITLLFQKYDSRD